MLADLHARLKPLERKTSPLAHEIPRADAKDAHWVTPRLVGEVSYAERTGDGRLRHPSWRGLRPDKEVSEVVRES
jgi:bifunctional non-homologous end joining protein LigD